MTKLKLPESYPFLYETHLHTCESSACAKNGGAEMARACKEAGYTGIFVTDHNWGGNTCVDRRLPFKEWVAEYVRGYEKAKKEGDRIGLDVFFGYEAGYRGTEFLIFGVEPDFMLTHSEIRDASVEEQFLLVHEAGGVVIHAHPFREEYYIPEIRLYPEYVDGVEGINATHSNTRSLAHSGTVFDERALAYAREHRLPLTAGSDIHSTELFGGGMAFRRRLSDSRDFIRAWKEEDYLLTNGDNWWTREGMKL